jgi:hypothetical protein
LAGVVACAMVITPFSSAFYLTKPKRRRVPPLHGEGYVR